MDGCKCSRPPNYNVHSVNGKRTQKDDQTNMSSSVEYTRIGQVIISASEMGPE